jgi:hypothetical protein
MKTHNGAQSDPIREYEIGIDDHYGMANLVSVAVSGHSATLLDKRRVALIDRELPSSPYHHDTLRLPHSEAEAVVRAVRARADTLATIAMSSLISDLAPARCRGISIRVPPLDDLPATVAEVHANPWIMYRADGMIYHQSITRAAMHCKLSVFHFEKARAVECAAQAWGMTARDLDRQLKALGKAFGPPWRKDHVIACAGAILAHAAHPRRLDGK